MVKGVNKSVIEISQTGSKYFSKIILYVSPAYTDISSYKLVGEAEKIVKEFTALSHKPLRAKIKRMKIRRIVTAVLGTVAFVAFTVVCCLIFK